MRSPYLSDAACEQVQNAGEHFGRSEVEQMRDTGFSFFVCLYYNTMQRGNYLLDFAPLIANK